MIEAGEGLLSLWVVLLHSEASNWGGWSSLSIVVVHCSLSPLVAFTRRTAQRHCKVTTDRASMQTKPVRLCAGDSTLKPRRLGWHRVEHFEQRYTRPCMRPFKDAVSWSIHYTRLNLPSQDRIGTLRSLECPCAGASVTAVWGDSRVEVCCGCSSIPITERSCGTYS